MSKSRKKPIHPMLIALGTEIKTLRKKRKLSLEAVGSEIGLDASNLQKIEMGQNLTISSLFKICICLKISPSRLLGKLKWDLTSEDLDSLTTPRTVKNKKVKKQRER